MTLRRSPPAERCDFPAWFKGPRRWHSLAGSNQYVYHQRYVELLYLLSTMSNPTQRTTERSLMIFFFFQTNYSDGSMHILKANGHMETRALCEQINKNAATETQVIVHQTTGW